MSFYTKSSLNFISYIYIYIYIFFVLSVVECKTLDNTENWMNLFFIFFPKILCNIKKIINKNPLKPMTFKYCYTRRGFHEMVS